MDHRIIEKLGFRPSNRLTYFIIIIIENLTPIPEGKICVLNFAN
jgi:hypothetical protein